MARSPEFKIYNRNEYVAACKYAEDAAALVAILGDGAKIKYGHSLVVWREGKEGINTGDNYDKAAAIMWTRIHAVNTGNYIAAYGSLPT